MMVGHHNLKNHHAASPNPSDFFMFVSLCGGILPPLFGLVTPPFHRPPSAMESNSPGSTSNNGTKT
jgi:hypothetical protein